MLCDTILAYIDSPVNLLAERLAPPTRLQRDGWKAFNELLRNAPKFVLDRDAVQMVHVISESTPKRFSAAINVCRLPYPILWVEFAFKDRTEWLEQATKRGTIKTVVEPTAPPPERIGFLLQQMDDDGRVISVHPAWNHKDGAVSFCHLALKINTSTTFQSKMSEEKTKSFLNDLKKETWANKPGEVEASLEIENRIGEYIPEYLESLWIGYIRTFPDDVCLSMMNFARGDLLSEWRFILALLTTMNSRNIFNIEPETDLSRLNKSRAKSGKPPLLATRTIKLSLSKVQKNRLGLGGSRDIKAHMVKGHFKLRSSGLYWWTPHVRGNIGTVKTPIYQVKK